MAAGEIHSLAFAHIPCLLLACLRSPYISANLGKFGRPSEDDPTVSFHHCRGKNASDMARSANLRVTRCIALETLADYFACWNSVHLYDRCASHCSAGNHPDDFLHYFLGSQSPLGWDRHNL
jgi:hypothetical protein